MNETLAIATGVAIGNRDVGRPVLWFSVHTTEHSGALQILTWDDAKKVIEETGIENILELNGRPCWVECDEKASTIRFVRFWKRMP